MYTLGIETSCDETGCAVVRQGKVLSNKVSSSVRLHMPYGGVIPEIASRYHIEYIDRVLDEALRQAGIGLSDLGLISVTNGPGLPGCLLAGISYAKALSYSLGIPLIGVNHIQAHLYANFLDKKLKDKPGYPFIGLAVSGGHSSIYLCKTPDETVVLGSTRDDAIGEAFDKVAKILGLGYPGGPLVEKKALEAPANNVVRFPKAFLGKDSLDLSFSGVKTAVLYFVRGKKLSAKTVSSICGAFQDAVFDTVVEKTFRASAAHHIDSVLVGGGVACNKALAGKLNNEAGRKNIKIFIPEKQYCLDNGAMVAGLGENLFTKGLRAGLDLTIQPNMVPRPAVRDSGRID